MAKIESFQFLYDLHLVRKRDGDKALFYVSKPYTVAFWLDRNITVFTVPEGTWTDFASIPKIVPRFIVDKLGPHIEAAVIHDYMCQIKGPWDSRTAADIFLAAMLAAGTPVGQAHLMHKAVVMFGPKWEAPNA